MGAAPVCFEGALNKAYLTTRSVCPTTSMDPRTPFWDNARHICEWRDKWTTYGAETNNLKGELGGEIFQPDLGTVFGP